MPTIIVRANVDPDYASAQQRYAERRRAAFEFGRSSLAKVWGHLDTDVPLSAVRLTEIDEAAIKAWRRWPECPYPDANFPWDRIVENLRRRPRRFELAIWERRTLCGLCSGLASNGSDNVTIRFLERSFGDNPLRRLVALIAAECAKGCAAALGKHRVKLKNPNRGAIPRYEDLGFLLAEKIRGATYYALGVEDDAKRNDGATPRAPIGS